MTTANVAAMAPRAEGITYNIKLDTGETGPEGKKVWQFIGKAFIRSDGTGGVLFVGEEDQERKYRLFPRDGKLRLAQAPAGKRQFAQPVGVVVREAGAPRMPVPAPG
jgi:hypothetical protein